MNRNTALILALLGGVGAFLFAARSRAGETPAGGNGGGSGDQGALPGAGAPSLWEQWRDTPADATYTPGFGPAPPGQPGGTPAPAQQPLEPTPAPEPVSTSQLAPYKWGPQQSASDPLAPLTGSVIDFNQIARYKQVTVTGDRIYVIKPVPFRYMGEINVAQTTLGFAPGLKITKDQAGQIPVDGRCAAGPRTETNRVMFTNDPGARNVQYLCLLNPGQTYYLHVYVTKRDTENRYPNKNTYYLNVRSRPPR